MKTEQLLTDLLLDDNEELSNRVCSPISLFILLDIIAEFEEGSVKENIYKILNDFNYSREKFLNTINQLSDTKTSLTVASSLWYNEMLTPKTIQFKEFESFPINFRSAFSKHKINTWVRKKTKNLIKKIDLPIPNPNINIALLTSLYFKGFWVNEFKAPHYPDNFTLLDGTNIQVGYLGKSNKEPISYIQKERFSAIALPYKDSNIQFEIYLPSEEIGFYSFISTLEVLDLPNINSTFKETNSYSIAFPKFETTSSLNLKHPLSNNSLSQLFDLKNSSYVQEKIKSSLIIKQKNTIKVNEKGTEAASITYGADIGSLPIFDIDFTADRPFLFLLRDNQSNAILFIGMITHPSPFRTANIWWLKLRNCLPF